MGRLVLYLILFFALSGCFENTHEKALPLILEVQKEYAPDYRTGIFSIEAKGINPVILSGETNLEEAKNSLLAKFDSAGIVIKDEITVLPDAQIGALKYGIINLSVANLRAVPKHSAELVTQALMGTPVNIFKEDDGWFLIQTPDKYIAWVTAGSLVQMNQEQLTDWKKRKKIIYLNSAGFARNLYGSGRVSDLVAGDILTLEKEEENFWKVIYPDDRLALVAKPEALELVNWQQKIELSDSSIMEAALEMTGIPYLWGGTSTKGFDCSGFTKTVYLLHGLILPRDASQQVLAGTLADSTKDFSQLKIGDLLFFGRKNADGSEKVIHVGLWLGDNNFIHSSGDVHISSLDSLDENFDRYNFDRYLRAKRIIGNESPLVIDMSGFFPGR